MAKRRANLEAKFPSINELCGDARQTGRVSIKLEFFNYAVLEPAANQASEDHRPAPRHIARGEK